MAGGKRDKRGISRTAKALHEALGEILAAKADLEKIVSNAQARDPGASSPLRAWVDELSELTSLVNKIGPGRRIPWEAFDKHFRKKHTQLVALAALQLQEVLIEAIQARPIRRVRRDDSEGRAANRDHFLLFVNQRTQSKRIEAIGSWLGTELGRLLPGPFTDGRPTNQRRAIASNSSRQPEIARLSWSRSLAAEVRAERTLDALFDDSKGPVVVAREIMGRLSGIPPSTISNWPVARRR